MTVYRELSKKEEEKPENETSFVKESFTKKAELTCINQKYKFLFLVPRTTALFSKVCKPNLVTGCDIAFGEIPRLPTIKRVVHL